MPMTKLGWISFPASPVPTGIVFGKLRAARRDLNWKEQLINSLDVMHKPYEKEIRTSATCSRIKAIAVGLSTALRRY